MKFVAKITSGIISGTILMAVTAVPLVGMTSAASAALWCNAQGNCATVEKCPILKPKEQCAGIHYREAKKIEAKKIQAPLGKKGSPKLKKGVTK